MLETYLLKREAAHVKIVTRGDLQIDGMERSDIQAEYDRAESMQVREIELGLRIECRSDLDLRVPLWAIIEVEHVGGDATLQNLQGDLAINRVEGDLEIMHTSQAGVNQVKGDLEAGHIKGSLAINRVGGDVEITDVSGDVAISSTGGDLDVTDVSGKLAINGAGGDVTLENTGEAALDHVSGDLDGDRIQGNLSARRIGGDVDLKGLKGSLAVDTAGGDLSISGGSGFRTNVGGDADLELDAVFSGEASLNAGGDLSLHLPAGSDARLEVASGGGKIHLDLAGIVQELRGLTYHLTLGAGSNRILLRAGGDVSITSPDPAAAPAGQPQGFSGSPASKASTGVSGVNLEEIEAQVLASTRRVAEQIDAARQRLEKRGIYIPGLTNNPPPPATPEAKSEPVGEDERLIILRMLQDKKITIEEAEQLLEALDAQDLTFEE